MGAGNPKLPAWMRSIKAGMEPAAIHPEERFAPVLRKKPAVIATQFMGDVSEYTPEMWTAVISVIQSCQHHVFLMLTKWPERITETLPDNVWIGTSITDQETADARIPKLLSIRAKHKWVSIEPMLGPVDLFKSVSKWLVSYGLRCDDCFCRIEFVACGPETGPGQRSFAPVWLHSVAHKCEQVGVTFYDKQDPDHDLFFTRREWPEEWKAVKP